jgi:hypothetical protein
MEMIFIYGLVFLVLVLNVVDVFQTRKILRAHGSEGEANFLMRGVYRRWNFTGLIIVKAILIAFALSMGLLIQSLPLMLVLAGMYIFAVIYNWTAIRYDSEIL